ncbi:MAG: ATP-grasp domain-containing protein, partial [Planctomycetaceae bacterium]|nr:ATP-grasp domain-containing protein [Planctomycetaceae bacterium]
IAPELGGILETLTRLVEAANVRNLGSNSIAVQIAADKYTTAQLLERHSVPTIPTWKLSENGELDGGISETFQQSLKGRPVLIKPRFGAGSQEMSVHQTLPDTNTLTNMIAESDWLSDAILQPYFPSLPLTVAVWCVGNDRDYHPFPVGLQILSNSEHFEYLGGLFPRQHPLLSEQRRLDIRNLAVAACRAIPGLQGYVGVDLILPHEGNSRVLVCEINPRLTTSYLGYRTLSRTNLASQWFEYSPQSIEFDSRPLRFTCEGAIELLD